MNADKNPRSKIPVRKAAAKRKRSENTQDDMPVPSGTVASPSSSNTSFDQNPEFKAHLKERLFDFFAIELKIIF